MTRESLFRIRVPLFWVGVLLWVGVMVMTWPVALSFADEVGYVGQAKLMLQGRIHPTLTDPGVWHANASGLYPKYPLLLPTMVVPLLAVSPSLIFLLGVVAAVALAWISGRVLQSWGRDPVWGLLVLMDPTVVTVARTVMADVLLACFAVLTWYFMRRGAFWRTALFAMLTIAIKTNGLVTVGALMAGAAWDALHNAQEPAARRWRPLYAPILGLAIGGAIVIATNLIANGTIHSGYKESAAEAFGLRFLATSGVAHLKSLLICPPLLIVGIWAFWRRREVGPMFAIAASTLMMSVYFFVDWGQGQLDTLVLSRRLILPVVAFLLIGYADILAKLAVRLAVPKLTSLVIVCLPALVAAGIGLKHQRWQAPRASALERAKSWTIKSGKAELGITTTASKVGLLFPGHTALVDKDGTGPAVILCGTSDPSYRMGNVPHSCDIKGYRAVELLKHEGYEILTRLPETP